MDATKDPAALRRLWKLYPGIYVGVATGEGSNLDVLDIDITKHPEAAKWYQDHAGQLGGVRWHMTRSGGRHYLFWHKDGLRCAQALKWQHKKVLGLDIRADGGYIIWWPAAGFGASSDPIGDWPPEMLVAIAPYIGPRATQTKKSASSVDSYASILPALLNSRRYRALSPVAKRVHLWAEAAYLPPQLSPAGFTLPYGKVTEALGIGSTTLRKALHELKEAGLIVLKKSGTQPGSTGFLTKRLAATYNLPHRNTGHSDRPWLEKNEQNFEGYWSIHVERLRNLVKRLGDYVALLTHLHVMDRTSLGGVPDCGNIPRVLTDRATSNATGLPKTTLVRGVAALIQAGCIEVVVPGNGCRATTYCMTARECRGDRPPKGKWQTRAGSNSDRAPRRSERHTGCTGDHLAADEILPRSQRGVDDIEPGEPDTEVDYLTAAGYWNAHGEPDGGP